MTKSRLPVGAALAGLVLASAMMSSGPVVQAQTGPVLSPAQVLGANVTFVWTAVAGATNYVVRAGVAPGVYFAAFNVGNTTTTGAAAPAVGTYYVRVDAIVNGTAMPSNEITVVVTSMFVPPAAPTGLEGFINGTSVLLTWTLGTGGGAPTNLLLFAGTTPGGSDVGVFSLAASATQMSAINVPARTYYLRLVAQNQGGTSAASNEVVLTMPVGGGCSAPPSRGFSTAAFGRYVQFSWSPVPGISAQRLDFSTAPGGPATLSQPFGPTTGRWGVSGAPLGTFYGRLVSAFSCGSQSAGPEVAFTIDGAPPPGPRSPNPPAGQRLPFRNDGGVIDRLAAERPDLLNQSCKEHGGNNRFMFEAVRRLRAIDNRYGLNWKRGLRGDLSQDIVNYNYGSESDEDTQQVYIIDIIGGHCGNRPTPAWINQTDATRNAGTIGIWTLIPYLDAGYPIVSDPQQDPQ